MGWLARFIIVSILFYSVSAVCANSEIVDCSSYGDMSGEAKTPQDPLYMDMSDTVGLMDVDTITIYVNDPGVRENAKFISGFGNAYGDFYTSEGPVQESSSGNYRAIIPYGGLETVSFGFRNKYGENAPMSFMFEFIAMKPYPEGSELEEYRRGSGNPQSPWYQWGCSENEDHPLICGGQSRCKACTKRVGMVIRQYMSYARTASAQPPSGYTLTPGKRNPISVYQSYDYDDQKHYIKRSGADGRETSVWCPQAFSIGASQSYGRSLKDYDNIPDIKRKAGATVNMVSGPGGMASGPAMEVIFGEPDTPCTGSNCDTPYSMAFSYELYAEMEPKGSGTMEVKASKKWCTSPNKLKVEIEKLKSEARAFLASYKLEGSNPKSFKSKVCIFPAAATPAQNESVPATISGRITDGHNHPLAYMKLTLEAGGKEIPGFTDESGNYQFKDVKGLEPDEKDPPSATLKAEFSYWRDGKNYISIPGTHRKPAYITKKFSLKTDADLIQNIDLMFNPGNSKTQKVGGTEYGNDWQNLKYMDDFGAIYYYLSDAVDFSLTIIDGKIDYKLPVEVYFGNGTFYSPDISYINIDLGDFDYSVGDRPKNREYHEFSHHLMFAEYGGWPEGRLLPNTKNHDGFLNPSSADSFMEGFAEFMAMVMSEYTDDPDVMKPPAQYFGSWSGEDNVKVWERRGKAEEMAIAGVLWDIHDKTNEDGDEMTLTIQQMWPVLKVKRKDFYEYVKAFKQAFPDKSQAIDKICLLHGVFADNNTGNKVRDAFEPYQPTQKGAAYTLGNFFVDYGVKNNSLDEIVHDPQETIGKSTSYGRQQRSKMALIPDAYIKAPAGKVRFYSVSVKFKNPIDGLDREYTTEERGGFIYISPLVEGVDATITVTPKSQDYTSTKPYTISSKEYDIRWYASEGKGYFDTHDFELKPTGQRKDPQIVLIDGSEPRWDTDRGYDVHDPPHELIPSGGGGLHLPDQAKNICFCIPLLPIILAGLSALMAKI